MVLSLWESESERSYIMRDRLHSRVSDPTVGSSFNELSNSHWEFVGILSQEAA